MLLAYCLGNKFRIFFRMFSIRGVSPECSVPLQLPPKLMRKLRSPNPIRINIISLVAMFFSNLLATKTQILEPLVQDMASKYIACPRKTLTLRILRALSGSSDRSKLCQDVPSIARSNASHGPSGNVSISASIQDCLQASVKNVNAVRNC